MKETVKKIIKKLMERKWILGIVVGVIIIIIVAIILILKGKNNKSFLGKSKDDLELKLTVSQNNESISVFFDYPKNEGIIVQDTKWENEKVVLNEDKNYRIDLTLLDTNTNYYNNEQEDNKEETGYEEVIFDKYNGYIYKYTDNIIEGRILLNASDNICKYVSIRMKTNKNIIDGVWTEVEPLYRLEEVQSILNSFEYKSNGIIEEKSTYNDENIEEEENFIPEEIEEGNEVE